MITSLANNELYFFPFQLYLFLLLAVLAALPIYQISRLKISKVHPKSLKQCEDIFIYTVF